MHSESIRSQKVIQSKCSEKQLSMACLNQCNFVCIAFLADKIGLFKAP